MTPFRATIGASSPNAHHFTPPPPTLQHQDAMFAPPSGRLLSCARAGSVEGGSADRLRGRGRGPARRPDPQLGERQPPVAGAHRGTARPLPRARREPLRLRRNHALARALEPQSLADQAELVLAVCDEAGEPGPARRSLLRRVGRAHRRAAARASARPTWCCSSPIRSTCFSPRIAPPRGSRSTACART